MFNTSPIKSMFIALAALVVLAAPASAAAKKPSLRVLTDEPVAGGTVQGKAFGVRKGCRLTVDGDPLQMKRRGSSASWSFVADEAGSYAARLRCQRAKAAVTIEVLEADDPGEADPAPEPSTPKPADPKPTYPRLTGSDAEAEVYWQNVKPLFERVNTRGWCADYAYFKRPDIPERVEKAAYKAWISEGGRMLDYSTEKPISVNDMERPYPWDFGQQSYRYADWGGVSLNSSSDAWVTGARRAGFRTERLPFDGAIFVQEGHVRYVERVLPRDPQDNPATVRYEFTEMNASQPGRVFRGRDLATQQSSEIRNWWFVG